MQPPRFGENAFEVQGRNFRHSTILLSLLKRQFATIDRNDVWLLMEPYGYLFAPRQLKGNATQLVSLPGSEFVKANQGTVG
ncbi:MAG: hypothetical protein DMG39_28620 [Acidobacteria bacterium]|nr:MAG: hypothetical protein DMG39_28620 [Acidobacteriota bacterium]